SWYRQGDQTPRPRMSHFRTVAGRLPRWAWLVAACLVGGSVAWAFWPQRPPELVDRGFLHADLSGAETRAEFGAILGPPGRYETRVTGYESVIIDSLPTSQPVEWADDYARVIVWF